MQAPKMDLTEFRDLGYLQEVNRRLLHPLGLAMFADVEEDGTVSGLGVFDDRDDPEGWIYLESFTASEDFRTKASQVEDEWQERTARRREVLGFDVQPR